MTDEKKKLDYRGKLILAPMVKVSNLVKNCMTDHE
jgi:tRNA-dihydrouridine synthase